MNQKNIIAILVIIIIVFFGTTIYFATINKSSKSAVPAQESAEEKPGAINTTEQQPNTIAGWNMYINETNGFSFEYPPIFEKSSDVVSKDLYTGLAAFEVKKDKSGFIVGIENKKFDPNNIDGLYGKIENNKITKIVADGVNGVMYRESDAGCAANLVLFPLKDKTLHLTFSVCEKELEQSITDTYRNQILSTLKLIK